MSFIAFWFGSWYLMLIGPYTLVAVDFKAGLYMIIAAASLLRWAWLREESCA